MAIRPKQINTSSRAFAISPEKECFVIIKAREFDVRGAVTEPDAQRSQS
jgi:hypothetical protein